MAATQMTIHFLSLIDECGDSGSVCAKLYFVVDWVSDQNNYIVTVMVAMAATVLMGVESK